MSKLFTKENLARLTSFERQQLMYMQMQPRSTPYGNYLPDDCSECGACGTPILGSGWCTTCYNIYKRLEKKALGF